MPTQEIPRQEWHAFFDMFSRQHQGRTVTMEMLGPDLGDIVEARQLPLQGMTVEDAGDEKMEIEIVVGDKPGSHVSHTATEPLRVWLKLTEEGAAEALEIESEERAVLLRFQPPGQQNIGAK